MLKGIAHYTEPMMDRARISWNGWGWVDKPAPLAQRPAVWPWLAELLGVPALLATPARALEDCTLRESRLNPAEIDAFIAMLGEGQVSQGRRDRAFHALGRSYHDLLRLRAGDLLSAPDLVLYPRNAEDVAAILAYAQDHSIAVVPFGGGTSVVGGVSALRGHLQTVVTLDLSRLNRVLDIDRISMTAEAEAGIFGPDLEMALQAQGLTLGHYPQSFEFSTLGGWIAHSGAGQQSNLYGRAADWFVSASLATPRGIWATETGPASAAGPRMGDLVPGSEGVLGVITKARFRLRDVPPAKLYVGYLFPDMTNGCNAMRAAMQERLPLAMLRLSDAEETRFYRAQQKVGEPRTLKDRLSDMRLRLRGLDQDPCAMIAGFEGDQAHISAAHKRFRKIAEQHGALYVGQGVGESWLRHRFEAPYMRDPMLDRGLGVDTLETSTSWARLPALHRAVREALHRVMADTAPLPGARGIVLTHVSHSYADGASLYFTLIFPRTIGGEIPQWRKIKTAASEAILQHGGTISHHHGVGEDHLPWIAREKGEQTISILRAIKHKLDPAGILNPGKLLPPA